MDEVLSHNLRTCFDQKCGKITDGMNENTTLNIHTAEGGKALGYYQGGYKLEVNQAGMSTLPCQSYQ